MAMITLNRIKKSGFRDKIERGRSKNSMSSEAIRGWRIVLNIFTLKYLNAKCQTTKEERPTIKAAMEVPR